MTVECLVVSRGVIWQPGHAAEESITATADGLRDRRKTSGRGDRVIADKLVPFDLQQLSLALRAKNASSLVATMSFGARFSIRLGFWHSAVCTSANLGFSEEGLSATLLR